MLRLPKPSFELMDHHYAIIAKACPNPDAFGVAWKAYLSTYSLTTEHFEQEKNTRMLRKKNWMPSLVFGLTGGICSGKSTASRFIAKHDIPIVDADLIAREIVLPGSPMLEALIATFGKEYLTSDGELNRAKLGELVFNDPESMQVLNAMMAPAIDAKAKERFKQHQEAGKQLICYDAALIVEAGQADFYRPLILIYCEPELQLQRLMTRDSLSQLQAEARIKAQMSLKDKLKFADLPVSTDGTLEETETQINNIVLALKWTMKEKNQ